MRSIRIIWLAMSMVTLLAACKKDKKENPLTVDKAELGIAGFIDDVETIKITTNTNWKITVEGNADWLSIEPASGKGDATVLLRNTINNYSDIAEVTLTLSGEGSKPVSIRLTRKPLFYKPALNTVGGSYGEDFQAGIPTPDGGYILVGSTQSRDHDFSTRQNNDVSYYDGIAVKYSAAGGIEWKQIYGGNGDDQLVCVTATDDGGYLMAGNSTSSEGDFAGKKGSRDWWILKVDKSGIKKWSKLYGTYGNDEAYGCVAVNDGYIITGIVDRGDGDLGTYYGLTDAWVIKLNTSGGIVWKKTYGGSDHDGAKAVIRTADGNCVIAGNYGSSNGNAPDEPKGSQDAWLLKLDAATGDKIWTKSYGGTNIDVFYSLHTTDKGDLIAVGTSNSNDGQLAGLNKGKEDGLVIKAGADGQFKWASLLGGKEDDRIYTGIHNGNKGFIVAGNTYSNELTGSKGSADAMISWLDKDGKEFNKRIIGSSGADGAELLLKTTYNRYVVGGFFSNADKDFPLSRGNTDCWSINFE